ncbi:MAG: peptide cleavage/export ABC transporter, partial [Lactobacillus sp.]|nr:peptide cleavage/export ABC transporter [Lactobacillus sp.]
MIKKIYISQVDETDCGVACLAMIFKHFGTQISLAKLRNLAKTDQMGTTALGLVKTAQKLNFETKAIKADMSLFSIKDLPLPFIVHVIKSNNIEHYYVVINCSEKYVKIADPDPTVKITKMPKEKFSKEWTGVAIFIAPKSTYEPIKEKKSSLLSLVPDLLKQKKLLLNIVLAALLTTLISILGSYFLQAIIDTYIPNNMQDTLAIIALGLIIFYIFQAIFTYAEDFLLTILGQRMSIDINLGYIKHIFKLPMDFFATRNTGEIVSRFSDASKIIDALASAVLSMLLDVGIVVIMGIILGIQSTKLFLLTLISIPIYIVVILAFTKPFERLNRETMESNSVVSSSIIEDIRGIETIKGLNSEEERYQKIDSEFVDFLKKSLAYTKSDTLQQAIKLFIQLTLDVFILWTGANLVIHNSLSIGQLMTYNALLSFFINPLQNIINLQPKLQSAQVANNRLNEVFLVESEFKKKRPLKQVSQLKGPIELKNISYQYGYGTNVLHNLNLTITENEKLTIVGMSGSGKSTLVKLLVNFFEPASGEILINGHQLQTINKHTLRSYINYLPQDPYIFSGTILDNLKLGNRAGTKSKEIIKACQTAVIANDIAKMPLQFDTHLDEDATVLSGGQKQRIAIARALLSPAKVLILDESTSGLDTITEKQLVKNLLALKDRTIIFIAHRLAIARETNNIIVLDNGSIV